jgi:hypothetical protein
MITISGSTGPCVTIATSLNSLRDERNMDSSFKNCVCFKDVAFTIYFELDRPLGRKATTEILRQRELKAQNMKHLVGLPI